jgi:Transposase DDE domain
MVWRYVISTRAAEGRTITRWGKRRWRVEAFFKTMKSRFGLDQFGQRTAQGTMRFLLLALLAFVLAYWTALEMSRDGLQTVLDWGRAARLARDDLVPEVIARAALRELQRVKPILESRGVMCYTHFI